MANNHTVSYLGDGSTSSFDVPFPFLSKGHVNATVGGSSVPVAWSNDGRIVIDPPPPPGSIVRVFRRTPGSPLFTIPDNRPVPSTWYNDLTKQAIFIAEESSPENMEELEDFVAAAQAAVDAAREAVDSTRSYGTLERLLATQELMPIGTVAQARNTGFAYRVVGSDPSIGHYTTAAGQRLVALGGYTLLLSGQSNIRGSNAAALGGDLTPDHRIRLWLGDRWETWDPANGVGAWGGVLGHNNIGFQAAKQALRDGIPAVWVIMDAHPGNTIDQWVANPSSGAWGPNLTSLVAAAAAATSSVEALSAGAGRVNGFIWGQGENNGGSAFDFEDYRARWDWLKTHLRAQPWFHSSVPITALSMPPQPSSRVMDRFWRHYIPFDGDSFTSCTDTSDLPAPEGNLMHWSGATMNEIGKRAWSRLAQGGISLPGPSAVFAPSVRYALEPLNGFGLTYGWVDGGDPLNNRVVVGASSNSNPGVVVPYLAFWRARNLIQLAQHTEALGPFTFKSYTAAHFSNVSHAVNTDPNKKEGATCWDVTSKVFRTALGASPTSGWRGTDGTTLTPS